jgi:hypothetical protein
MTRIAQVGISYEGGCQSFCWGDMAIIGLALAWRHRINVMTFCESGCGVNCVRWTSKFGTSQSSLIG